MLLSRDQIAIAALALAVAAPAVLLTSAEAEAGPFDILRESRDGGEREHKVKRKRQKTKSQRDDDARSHGQRRTGRTRPATSGDQNKRDVRNVDSRRTGRTRDANSHDRRSRTRSNGHVHTSNCVHNTRRNERRDDHYDRRRSRGHDRTHRHDHDTRRHRHGTQGSYSHSHSSSSSMSVSVSGSSASIHSSDTGYASSSSYRSRGHRHDDYGHDHYEDTSSSGSANVAMPEVFVSLGMGAAGFRADQIADKALPGQDYALAVGVKGDWLGAELGVAGGGFRLDPDASGNDIALAGVTADVRLQPKIDFVEPYLKAGVGAHRMYDGPIDESSSGTSLRLGAGVDFRGDHLGVGVEYLWSAYGIKGDTGAYGGHLSAQSGAIGARILYHF